MKGIAALFSALAFSAAGLFAAGCATQAAGPGDAGLPRLPFPHRDPAGPAGALMAPTAATQAQMDGAIIDLFRRILLSDLIVDSGGPQTRDGFRMVLRHFQAGEVAYGLVDVSHIATSESQGYGMMMMAYMAGSEERLGLSPEDWIFGSAGLRDYFDAMLRAVLEFPSSQSSLFALRLLGYRDIALEGVSSGGYRMSGGVRSAPFARDAVHGNSSTGGNMDIIYALLLADRQWGSGGRHDYIGIARAMLADLWRFCVHEDYRVPLLGDWVKAFGSPVHRGTVRTSDLMIGHLKAFRDADPAHDWQAVIDASLGLIAEIRSAQNALGNANGFLPDFAARGAAGWEVPAGNIIETDDSAFAYNAVRVPWRLGAALIQFGAAAPGADILYGYVLRPLDDFARAFAGAAGLSRLGPMYMDGTPFAWEDPNMFAPTFAVAAAAVGADQQWVDAFWSYRPASEWAFQGLGAYLGDTYGDYIRLLALLAVSGNFWAP